MASHAHIPFSSRRAWRRPHVQLVRYVLLTLLIATAFSALFGGIVLIADPTGARLGLSLNDLADTALRSYLVPGIVLIALVASSCIAATIAVARRYKRAHGLCLLAGLMVCGFVAVQLLLIGARSALQAVFLIVGLTIAMLPGRLPVRSVLAPPSVR
jgi:cytochrome bd-type quinol oxidase subunit 2